MKRKPTAIKVFVEVCIIHYYLINYSVFSEVLWQIRECHLHFVLTLDLMDSVGYMKLVHIKQIVFLL